MKRASSKKGVDKEPKGSRESRTSNRSKTGSKPVSPQAPNADAQAKQESQEHCYSCSKGLSHSDRALFVEEQNSRVFCSEACITAFFTPEIKRLEKEYLKQVKPDDLSGHQREKYNHLRWVTLQDPDEVWRIKTSEGDYRYTLISEFKPGVKSVWCICICLFLRGEPSFLYLAFPTRSEALVNRYRKGTREKKTLVANDQTKEGTTMNHEDSSSGSHDSENTAEGQVDLNSENDLFANGDGTDTQSAQSAQSAQSDGLADAWTETETLRARLMQKGQQVEDIAPEDFGLYQSCMNETLETPDEVWSNRESPDKRFKVFHFIRFYGDEKPGVWFIVVARETEDVEEIELMDAFPTRDPELVECYRRGAQEIGGVPQTVATTKFMH